MTAMGPRTLMGFARTFSRPYSSTQYPLVVSPSEVTDTIHNTRFLDSTWFMPNSNRNPYDEYLAKRIPGAKFLDLDAVSSSHSLGLKHMIPPAHLFAEYCGQNEITPKTRVVIYDSHGVFSSPRALFMFRSFGHHNSSILNGGLPRWESEKLPLESGTPPESSPNVYSIPDLDIDAVRDYDQIVSNSLKSPTSSEAELVLDARSKGRYTGEDPEPRPGLSSGHIPNSISLPFNLFLEVASGGSYTTLLPLSELLNSLRIAIGEEKAEAVLSGRTRVVTSCGSGMSAAILWLGLKSLGVNTVSLYDESWTGYASRPESTIVKGEA